MIPLRSDARRRRFPWATAAIAALCLAAFAWQVRLGGALPGALARLAFVPAAALAPGDEPAPALWIGAATLSIFLHGGLLHLAGNLLFLAVFGGAVESALGPLRFATLYWLGGLTAAFAHAAANPTSTLPVVGASGAIAAVLGAALVLAPRARVSTLLVPGLFLGLVRVPAAVFLLLWLGLQVAAGWLELRRGAGGGPGSGVAWFAHIGGFLAGPLLFFVLRRR